MSGAGGGMSKAAKKNAKRHAKKQAAAGLPPKSAKPVTPADLLPILKDQLEEAKAAKDIELAGQLREQIWVLKDLIAGVKTEMPDETLIPVMARLEALLDSKMTETKMTTDSKTQDLKNALSSKTKSSKTVAHSKEEMSPSDSRTQEPKTGTEPEKRLRNLRKKLDQIQKLKERQANGEKLEDGQIEKIKSEEKTAEEIEDLEIILNY